ncbi:SDR family NAD(P)-dependent oxidoreductase [Blastococcus brunescens]|uniref:SDR family NAD(P)-dependent oxidoreductase n=1 Tax=Blastococcus brunescens TaxID=1564165 RepID=A0ABZ1AWP7_9ACTN|nr:SDR family NAD(P)-dependent oxidoreductase [Blastococcus sp. BMG 8361]WRL62361.1 SDR family NAD(P)-dependent oxidoreductase [Blastococcus sp. BMG 8361]
MTESSGRVAIITGSESGIGRATAVALAEQGCDVGITWFRDEAAGRRPPRRCGHEDDGRRCATWT